MLIGFQKTASKKKSNIVHSFILENNLAIYLWLKRGFVNAFGSQMVFFKGFLIAVNLFLSFEDNIKSLMEQGG